MISSLELILELVERPLAELPLIRLGLIYRILTVLLLHLLHLHELEWADLPHILALVQLPVHLVLLRVILSHHLVIIHVLHIGGCLLGHLIGLTVLNHGFEGKEDLLLGSIPVKI